MRNNVVWRVVSVILILSLLLSMLMGSPNIVQAATLPDVRTMSSVTDITTTSATIWGWIASDGGSSIVERRFDWGTSTPLTQVVWSSSIIVSGNFFWATLSGLSPSTTYYFRAWAKNSIGWGYGSIYSFTTSQAVTVPTTPTLNNVIGNSNSILLGWTDNSNNEDGFKIERKEGTSGTYTQVATTGANVYAYADTGLQFGKVYCYRVRAYNSAGNSGYSSEKCATTLSTPTLSYPSNGLTLNTNTVTLTWNSVVGANGYAIKVSKVSCGGGDIFDGASYSCQQQISNLANGVYYWQVQAAATTYPGLSEYSACRYFTISLSDTTNPTVSISSPYNGQTFTTSTIPVSGTASDNVGVSKVEVKVGAGSWQVASGTTSWSKQVTLSSGSNTIYARATDTSGNPSSQASVTVTYNSPDTTPPTVSIGSPSSGQAFTTSTIPVSGTASDNVGINKVEVKVGAGSWQVASGTTSWSKQVTLSSGSNTIYAKATDTSGNPSSQASVTVTYNSPDTTHPTVSISSPSSGQTFTTSTIPVSGTASDNVGISKVEVKVGAGSWQLASGTTSWSKQVALSSGSNTIYARATDASGNTGETSVMVVYSPTDITPPIAYFTYSCSRTPIRSGDIVNFDASGSEGDNLEYTWDFADSDKATGMKVSHRFRGTMNQPKTYTVSLTVKAGDGATADTFIDISVAPLTKTIEITHQPLIPTESVYAYMIALYNWIHDNSYVVSKVLYQCDGFTGVGAISVWDFHSSTIPMPVWAKDILTITSSNEVFYPNLETVLYGGDDFEGILVDVGDVMNMQICGWAGLYFSEGPSIPAPFYHLSSCNFLPDNNEAFSVPEEQLDFYTAELCSPGELRVCDSNGKITGLVNGVAKVDIPNSIYKNGIVLAISDNPLTYEIVGTATGSYGLRIAYTSNATTTFTATDIPTATSAVHNYTIDWNILSQSTESVTVDVDSNGDGITDYTLKAGNTLTGDEFVSASSWCFIATAAYGTPMAGEIQILREFRDEYLLTNSVGQGLVKFYYKVSPPIAEFITDHPSLKPIVRAGLLPAVAMSTVAVSTTPAEKAAIVGLLVLVSVALAVWSTRRRSRGSEPT